MSKYTIWGIPKAIGPHILKDMCKDVHRLTENVKQITDFFRYLLEIDLIQSCLG